MSGSESETGPKTGSENEDVNTVAGKPFSTMTGAEKAMYVGKVIVFLVTFGFVFPNILVD
jgi:hypothetical protein